MEYERWAGKIEERVENLPKRADLDAVRNESLTAIEKLGVAVERMLEKHEAATAKSIREEVTKTVEAAFNLQWSKIETAIAQKIPDRPKTDWKPYIMVAGLVLVAGAERAAPHLMKLL